jgi:hypothetical protein
MSADVFGHDLGDVVVQVDVADRARLGRGEVEAAVLGLVEAELLPYVQFPARGVDAPQPVLQAQNLAEP